MKKLSLLAFFFFGFLYGMNTSIEKPIVVYKGILDHKYPLPEKLSMGILKKIKIPPTAFFWYELQLKGQRIGEIVFSYTDGKGLFLMKNGYNTVENSNILLAHVNKRIENNGFDPYELLSTSLRKTIRRQSDSVMIPAYFFKTDNQ